MIKGALRTRTSLHHRAYLFRELDIALSLLASIPAILDLAFAGCPLYVPAPRSRLARFPPQLLHDCLDHESPCGFRVLRSA